MPDLQHLSDEYLVTIDGRNASEPCGAWCGDGDVDMWVQVVRRIAQQIRYTLRSNRQVQFSAELQAEIVRWMFQSMKFKGGNVTHIFGAGADEVFGMIAFSRVGVQLLFQVLEAVEAQDGNIVEPAPLPSANAMPGAAEEAWWFAGGMLLTLALLQLWSSR